MSASFEIDNDTSNDCLIDIHTRNGISVQGGNVRAFNTSIFKHIFAGNYTVTFTQWLPGIHTVGRNYTVRNNNVVRITVSSVLGHSKMFFASEELETSDETVEKSLNPADLKIYLAAGGKASDHIEQAYMYARQEGIIKVFVFPSKVSFHRPSHDTRLNNVILSDNFTDNHLEKNIGPKALLQPRSKAKNRRLDPAPAI
ncbi:hypothetical protein Q9L58_010031 [Maublancomyces gigas]|uniref:Uncharacterized protein n=1 Tax=Discina gigas TaxID=1032678 RepID=A0ABR3G5M8_9PEZI